MPLFEVDIEKQAGSEFWTNHYWVSFPTFAEAQVFGQEIVDVERSFHSTVVTFTRYRTSDPVSETYAITPIALTGQRGFTDILPLFNTLRFDLPATVGRPSRKMYRGVLTEGDISGAGVTADFSAYATALQGLLKSPAAESNGIVDPQAQVLVDVVVWPFVQMRQLRRGTRRRGTPILP